MHPSWIDEGRFRGENSTDVSGGNRLRSRTRPGLQAFPPGTPAVYIHSENGGSIVELRSLQGAFAGSSRKRIRPAFDVIRPSRAGSMLLEADPRETRRHRDGLGQRKAAHNKSNPFAGLHTGGHIVRGTLFYRC
jgi:hypothetical protein